MSQHNPLSEGRAPKRPKQKSNSPLINFLIASAFIFTVVVLSWSFSAPMRKQVLLVPDKTQSEKERIMKGLSPEQFRQQAISEHHAMLAQIRAEQKRRQQRIHSLKRLVPREQFDADLAVRRAKHQTRLDEIESRLTEEDYEGKSILWEEAQYLKGALADH